MPSTDSALRRRVHRPRTAHLVYWASGAGIAQDVRILTDALQRQGYRVAHVVTRNRKCRRERAALFLKQMPLLLKKRHLQVHIEQIHWEQFAFARNNVIIPNPELTDPGVFKKTGSRPRVFAKTAESSRLFKETGLRVHEIGFASEDCDDPGIQADYRKFLHVAGASSFKGTGVLLDVWRRNPQWPELTVIRRLADCYGTRRPSIPSTGNIRVIEDWLPRNELKRLQNDCGIHLCPSEMEGFGHYIAEAMSVGGVVVTTDAPPMNELVRDGSGFTVAARHAGRSYMGDKWRVEPDALEARINRILATDHADLARIGRLARKRFLEMNESFERRFSVALAAI